MTILNENEGERTQKKYLFISLFNYGCINKSGKANAR